MSVRNLYCLFPSEIRELHRSIETYNTVHDHTGDICIQEYLRNLYIGNTKSSKIDKIHKCYVLCLKLE